VHTRAAHVASKHGRSGDGRGERYRGGDRDRVPVHADRRDRRAREIAEVAVFLASDASGTTVYVDGGRLALDGVVPVGEAPNRANAALSCRTAAGARPPRVIWPCRLRSAADEW